MKTLTKVFLQGLIFCSTLLVIANAHAEKNFKGLHESIPEHHSVKKFAIRFDFDGDGCLPAPAVSRKGKKNEGLKTSGSQTGGCRETFQFDNANTYHRRLCIEKDKKNNYCVHMYALYFEKDQIALGPLAHRHDWEYGLVWTKNGKLTHASYSAHGDVETDSLDELKYKIEDKTHVKLVYHLDDGGFNSHAMRFAKAHERAENPKKKFVTPTLVDWYEMKGDGDYLDNAELRHRLEAFNYGDANCPVCDRRFSIEISDNPPSGYPSKPDWVHEALAQSRKANHDLKEYLYTRQYLDQDNVLESIGGKYRLQMQSDGHLVLLEDVIGDDGKREKKVKWVSSDSFPTNHYYAILQEDGNFVIYRGRGPGGHDEFKWSSGTDGKKSKDYVLELLRNGNLIIKNKDKIIWCNVNGRFLPQSCK